MPDEEIHDAPAGGCDLEESGAPPLGEPVPAASPAGTPPEPAQVGPAQVAPAQVEPAPVEPAPDPAPDHLAAIAGQIEGTRLQLERLARRFDNLQAVLDRVVDENRALRAGELEQAMQPVFMELVRMHDDLAATAAAYRDPERAAGLDPARDLDLCAAGAMDALLRLGVSRVEVQAGERFDPRVHNPVAAEPTDDPSAHMAIASIVRQGFSKGARSIRPPQVRVLRFTAPRPAPASQEPTLPSASSGC